MPRKSIRTIGVVIVSYESSDIIEECLNSLISSKYAKLKIVVCDNASPDHTCETIRSWASQSNTDFVEIKSDQIAGAVSKTLTLVNAPVNLGYAGAVNIGIKVLSQDPEVDLFWILNPDCVVEPETASAYAKHAENSPDFSLMGSRILYIGQDGIIQSDGGKVSLWTGICRNHHRGCNTASTQPPDMEDIQYIAGSNMVASRAFVDKAGPLREDYFLYYEEVDWALRRGDLPLVWCGRAIVHHHAGSSIGSSNHVSSASSFANFFNFRNRMIFVARFNRIGLPFAYIYSLLKVIKIFLKDGKAQARGAWRGLNLMAPPSDVMERIAPEARKHAFAIGKTVK